MSLKTQYQMKLKQAFKRRKRRKKLAGKNENLNEYYYGKYYIKLGSDQGR